MDNEKNENFSDQEFGELLMPENRPGLNRLDYLLAGLLPLLGIFIIWGPQILNRESLYLGIIQEQYFLLGQFSFDHLIRSEFANGYFPLWNPNNAFGSVLLGNMLSAALSPLKFFLYLFPALLTYELYLIFRFWLGGFFCYFLGRKLGLSRPASAFVLFGFSFSGYFQFFLNENYLSADFLLPLLLLLALKVSESKSKKWPLLLALALFALFNSGHPEAIFYNWLFVLVSFIGLIFAPGRQERFSGLARLILANVIALFLSFPLLLTFLEFWVRGYHFHLPGAGLYHYSSSEFLAIFSPWFFGPSSPGAPFFHKPELSGAISSLLFDYQSTTLPWLSASLGLIFLPLLAIAFLELKKLSRLCLVWLIWILVFLGLSFGLPIFQFLGLVFPFSLSGNFKHPWPGVILSAILISTLMLEKILAGKIKTRKIILASLAGLLLLLLFFPYSHFQLAQNSFLALEIGATILFFIWALTANVIATNLSAAAPAGAKAKAARTNRLKIAGNLGFGLAIVVLLLSAQLRSSWQEPVYLDYHLAKLRQNPIFQQIKNDPLARFYFEREIFPPNLNQLLEVADFRIMDGVNHHRLVELVNQVNGHSREQGFRYWYNEVGYLEVMPEKVEDPLLDLAGLKYVITRTPLPDHRSIERILASGEKRAPSLAHLGLAYFPLGNASAKTLFQHPPSLIRFKRCALYESNDLPGFCRNGEKDYPPVFVPPLILSFAPGIQKEAISKEPDGTWFLIIAGKNLGYARYLDPGKHPEEQNLAMMELSLGKTEAVSLATLPANNPDFDWAGWVDFRVDVPRQTEKLDLLSDIDFWFYQNPHSYPRFFLASQGQWEEKENDPLKKDSEPNHKIMILQEPLKNFKENPDLSETKINLTNFSSQSFELSFETDQSCWLVFSQILFPGWKAILDGKEEPLVPADFLTTIKISPGKHLVEIFYQPWSFRIGLYFSLSTLLALLASGLWLIAVGTKVPRTVRNRDHAKA